MKLGGRALMKEWLIGGHIMKATWTKHKTTQEWIQNQAIWNDKDMIVCGAVCFAIGILIGLII
jgi:hypothetical protein